jgi:hypothetical protein
VKDRGDTGDVFYWRFDRGDAGDVPQASRWRTDSFLIPDNLSGGVAPNVCRNDCYLKPSSFNQNES